MSGDGRGERARPLIVYGLGRSGLPVVERARAFKQPVAFYDARSAGADIDRALALGAVRLYGADLAAAAAATADTTVVAAPGVRIDHPHLMALRAAGARVIGEVEWVWERTRGTYVGVTGTAGKGTVTSWLAQTLAAAGKPAVAGGNLDPALTQVASPGKLHVVELSSFQLERCEAFAPQLAVILNLGEDHLDRHGTVAAYHLAKKRLLRNLSAGDRLVINAGDPLLAPWGEEAAARGVQVLRYASGAQTAPLEAEVTAAGALFVRGKRLLHSRELPLKGLHNAENALAVTLAAGALGLTTEEIRSGLLSFSPLPGRYAPAGTIGGVDFIEDSIATRPLAVLAALRATPGPLVWLAGGQAKGGDLNGLKPVVAEKVDLLITFGESARPFEREFGGETRVERCERPTGDATMAALVERALAYLRLEHGGRGSVLLAPLAASFDQFTDYRARGAAFRRAVAAHSNPGERSQPKGRAQPGGGA